jgi:hypothetical protein
MEIFGYSISRKEPVRAQKSIVPPSEDGSFDTFKASGYYGTYLDLDGGAKSEAELIKKYRDLSRNADVDMAIEDIINAGIANLENDEPLDIDLQEVKVSVNIKKLISEEFKYLAKKLNLRHKANDYFRRWYIDGRLYFHKVIDTENKKGGITDVRYIDPRKIRKIREIQKEKDPKTGVEFIKAITEYYMFNDKGMGTLRNVTVPTQGLKIHKDSIAFVPSGLVDMDTNMVLSYLHKAIKPANQLRMMENALVIYRLSRAPERRIFYIDVGNLPKIKAEQYLKDIMNRYRNKLVYDADTGEIRDDKKYMSMLEDFWLPRREGGKGTEITTLPGGQNLGEIEDIKYFQRKLYESLNVPVSRLEQQSGLNFGRAAEITRDELKFAKFVQKLQNRFATLFLDLLKTQLVLKNILTEKDWDEIQYDIKFKFAQDAYYAETKQQELLRSRAEVLSQLDPFVDKYLSKKYVMKNVLQFTDDEIAELENDMEEKEASSMDYSQPQEPEEEVMPAQKKETPKQKPKPEQK